MTTRSPNATSRPDREEGAGRQDRHDQAEGTPHPPLYRPGGASTRGRAPSSPLGRPAGRAHASALTFVAMTLARRSRALGAVSRVVPLRSKLVRELRARAQEDGAEQLRGRKPRGSRGPESARAAERRVSFCCSCGPRAAEARRAGWVWTDRRVRACADSRRTRPAARARCREAAHRGARQAPRAAAPASLDAGVRRRLGEGELPRAAVRRSARVDTGALAGLAPVCL